MGVASLRSAQTAGGGSVVRQFLGRSAGLVALVGGLTASGGGIWLLAQEGKTPTFQSRVDLVVLTFTVTDSKGKYVNGLKPSDFRIMEDGIKEKLSTFSEGNRPAMEIQADGSLKALPPGEQAPAEKAATTGAGDAFAGTNVFVLFDTSNFMYH